MAGLTPCVAACTTVRIEAPSDGVRIERHFGVLAVTIGDSGRAHTGEVSGLGIHRTPLGFSAGYSRHAWVELPPDDCRVVIWIADAAQRTAVDELLAAHPEFCAPPPPTPRKERP
jgi:hypothetical protein